MEGQIHLYTGNGKGKTTAAIGLSIRAAGAGKRVFIAQFIKGMPYAELEVLETKFQGEIDVKQYGRDCFIYNEPTKEDILAAEKGFVEVTKIIHSKQYELVVLDEITIALYYKLLSLESVLALFRSKPETIEIVLTGRYAPLALIEIADLVTEMKEVKHYYKDGVEARKGFEF